MKDLNLFFQVNAVIGKKEQNAKNRINNIFIFRGDIFRKQSDETPVGLHGEGGTSDLLTESLIFITFSALTNPDRQPLYTLEFFCVSLYPDYFSDPHKKFQRAS